MLDARRHRPRPPPPAVHDASERREIRFAGQFAAACVEIGVLVPKALEPETVFEPVARELRRAMPAYDPYKLLYRHTIGTTCLMRRELVTAVGGFDSYFGGYEDWEFWLHALEKGWHGRRVEEITFEYRRHGSTKLTGDRLEYRRWFKRLRRKHADLYARRRELARESDLSPVGRVVYRWWWGARPMPARFEHWLHSLLWGVARWRSDR